MSRLPEIPVDLWRQFQTTIFGEKADDIQTAESFRWGVDDALGQLPPDDGQDWEAEARRLEEEQHRRQEEQRRQIEEQARLDQEDYERIADERAVAARANQLAQQAGYTDPGLQPGGGGLSDSGLAYPEGRAAPAPTSTYNDPTAGGTISQPLPAPSSFSDTASSLMQQTFGSEPSAPEPAPEPPKPLSFADTASDLITNTFGPESVVGKAASGAYETAVRGGMPDVASIVPKGLESARETIDTYGMGAFARDETERAELERELRESSGKALVRPGGAEEQAWQAANPEKSARLEELRKGVDELAMGASGTMGGGGAARDAIDAIKALRKAGMSEAALNAERELAMKTPMTLEQIQQQTGAAIKKVADAVLPKPPEAPLPAEVPNPFPLTAEERALNTAADARAREAPPHAGYLEDPAFGIDEAAGPQPGDRIRLPDGTRARVEAPETDLVPTGPQPGDRVRLPDGTRARVEEAPPDLAPTVYEPPSSGALEPTIYEPPSAGTGGGGRQAPPGRYTTLNPPGPLAPTGGGVAGGPPAPGGPPGGGGNLPPVGSLYRGGGSASKDLPSLGSIARWFVRQNTDRRVDLNDLQKSVSREIGRPLNPDELVSELSRRNTNHAADIRQREQLRPIFQSMGEDLPYLSEALTYLDNIAVSKALGNPNRTFSWGLTAAESQARLPQLVNQLGGVNDPRAQKLNQAIRGIRKYTDDYRKRMLDSGVWSQELYNDLTTRYPTYIPTRILDYIKDNAAVASGKKLGLSDRGLRSHTLGGTALEREDPLASIVRLGYDSEKRIHQNEVFNAFVKLREASPSLQQAVRQVPTTYTPKQGETLVHGFVDGEKRIYAMTDPIAQTVMMADGQALPSFVRGVTNAFRALITHSPVFIAGQVPLDAFSYAVRESGRSKYGPLSLPQIGVDLVKAYGEAFRGLATGEFKGDAANLLREGGGMGGWQGRTAEAAKSRVSDLAHQNMFEIRNKGDIGRLVKWIATMQPVAAVGERVELAPRIASYRRAGRRMTDQTTTAMLQPAQGGAPIPVPQQGQRPLSSVERVMAARDVTLDFERGGLLSRVLNQAIPFYNVGWQSSAAVARAARENPVGFSVSALSIVGGLAVGAEAWNRSDPQLEKDYEDVPDYIKDRGVVFMLPGNAPLDKDGNRRPNYLTIPMRELAPIAIMAREAALKVAGKDTRAWNEILGASVAAASPIQATGAADLFSTVNPVGANTALQLATDEDFFRGQNIDTKFRREEASAASKALSATAQQHGLEWSPAQIEFALRDLGGGASRAGLAASDMLAGKVQDDSRIQNTPLAGDLIRRYVGDATGGVMNRERERVLSPDLRRRLLAAGVDYVPTPADFDIGQMPLQRSEVGEVQRLTNRYVDENIRALMADPVWATLTPEERRKGVQYQVAQARQRAQGAVLDRIDAGEANRRAEQAAQRKAAP